MPTDMSQPARSPASSFRRMRALANGLLALMTVLYVVSHTVNVGGWALGYVRAFAEAAMVGALADWFAVTAIFRRPLGLPIPHTAVIPKNQDRIADALGSFIAENFLAADLVRQRVEKQDMARALGDWLATPQLADRVADGLVSSIPPVLDTLDDETVAAFLKKQAREHMPTARLAPTFGGILEALAAQGRHQALLDAALAEGWTWLAQNQDIIRTRVRDRTAWYWRVLALDAKAADAMIGALEDLIRDAAQDPGHPLRVRVNEIVARFAADLRHDPALQARVAQWARDMLEHPAAMQAIDAATGELKAALRADAQSDTSNLRAWARDGLVRLGEGLREDESVRAALNERLRGFAVELAARHGPDVSRLVSETIRSWDADTVVEKLEQNVGRDLQFIRLNGTIIGGLVGLALHAGAEALAHWG